MSSILEDDIDIGKTKVGEAADVLHFGTPSSAETMDK